MILKQQQKLNFNSTKVQFGDLLSLNTKKSLLLISIPLRYNLEWEDTSKTVYEIEISIPLRYNLEKNREQKDRRTNLFQFH